MLRTVKRDTSPKVIQSLKVGTTLSWCTAARDAEQAITIPRAQPCFISLSSLQAIIVYFAVSNACNFNPANSFCFPISGRRMGVLVVGQLCLCSRALILHLQISLRSASHQIFLHFPQREDSQVPPTSSYTTGSNFLAKGQDCEAAPQLLRGSNHPSPPSLSAVPMQFVFHDVARTVLTLSDQPGSTTLSFTNLSD